MNITNKVSKHYNVLTMRATMQDKVLYYESYISNIDKRKCYMMGATSKLERDTYIILFMCR